MYIAQPASSLHILDGKTNPTVHGIMHLSSFVRFDFAIWLRSMLAGMRRSFVVRPARHAER